MNPQAIFKSTLSSVYRVHPANRLSLIPFAPATRHYSTSPIAPNVEKELALYSKKKQTAVSLKSLMESGRGDNPHLPSGKATKASEKVIMQVACFLHREMPVRLAHRAVKLEASSLFQKSGSFIFILLFGLDYQS